MAIRAVSAMLGTFDKRRSKMDRPDHGREKLNQKRLASNGILLDPHLYVSENK
ncbi:hypothetical protein SRABI05_04318 [Agrobacterium fabrum]|nr:hypothetical protein SRABI46_04289 [Agrobacterium fabrum]CAH0298448.1 hypothetical protein SRABI05_04318 [Agrobacterium fabrum]